MTLRATEGELKLTELLKEKLNPTYLAVEDMSGMTIQSNGLLGSYTCFYWWSQVDVGQHMLST